MQYDFRLQDPTDPATVYLFEAVIEAMGEASEGKGIFAFASRDGVNALLLDQAVTTFLGHASFDLIVGIDAVTNRPTLERLVELQEQYANLQVQVFWNRTKGLFHPKIARFAKEDGSQTVIVGSGNLTPGGLRDNFEAYSVLQTEPDEVVDLSSWDEFLARHNANIRPIDEEALERAARNIIRGGRRRRDVEPDVTTEEEEPEEEEEELGPEPVADRVLVAQLPEAGGRWRQAHFNKAVVDQFFQAQPNTTQRVFLTAWENGVLSPQEVRPVIYSHTNKNLKIELGARRGAAYPTGTPPIAVFREIQVRTFRYMIHPFEGH